MKLPDPGERPLLKVDDLIGLVPDMGRSALHDAVRRGQIPSVRIGSRVFVPTAALRRAWGLDATADSEGRPAGQPLARSFQRSKPARLDEAAAGRFDARAFHRGDRWLVAAVYQPDQ